MRAHCDRVTVSTTMKPAPKVIVKRHRGGIGTGSILPIIEKLDCNECKHRLVCLVLPNCNRVFESKQ